MRLLLVFFGRDVLLLLFLAIQATVCASNAVVNWFAGNSFIRLIGSLNALLIVSRSLCSSPSDDSIALSVRMRSSSDKLVETRATVRKVRNSVVGECLANHTCSSSWLRIRQQLFHGGLARLLPGHPLAARMVRTIVIM